MILHVRHVDDLRELLRDHPDQIRARILFAEEVHFDVDVGIVAKPGIGGLHADTGGHEFVVLRRQYLPAGALVDHDVGRLDSDRRQISRDLRDHVRHRHRARRTRRVDFDPDEILSVEEARPAVARVLVAGQRRHPARDHRLDGGHIHFFRDFVDDLGGVDRDHAPGIGTGHTGLCRRFVIGDDVIFRNRPRLESSQCRSRGHRRQKFSAIHGSPVSSFQLPVPQFPVPSRQLPVPRLSGNWQLVTGN